VLEDHWLGERIGRRVWTLEDDDDGSDVAGPAFIQTKVDCGDVERVGRLERAGMRVVDVNVTLRREAAPPPDESTAGVRSAEPGDREAVLGIAGSDYRVSRFHLDPDFPDDVADAIKRDWAGAFFDGSRGEHMLVATSGGDAVGFLLVLERGEERVIDLIAVASSARGAGKGSALVGALLAMEPLRPVLVGTQVSNTGATRLYERLGFAVEDTRYVLHRTVDA
jgi:ribosomal protein S18 acetylase RimI-like enzyme